MCLGVFNPIADIETVGYVRVRRELRVQIDQRPKCNRTVHVNKQKHRSIETFFRFTIGSSQSSSQYV